ncbi:hypothetical protein BH10PSE2_BH10PSE2_09750 [soil metagenome]
MVDRVSALAALIGATIIMGVSGKACAADDMPLGAPAAPPIGYVDMCERAPASCVETRQASASQLDAVRRWAGQTRWAVIFGERLGIHSPIVNGPLVSTAALKAAETVGDDAVFVPTLATTEATESIARPVPSQSPSGLPAMRNWDLTRPLARAMPLPTQPLVIVKPPGRAEQSPPAQPAQPAQPAPEAWSLPRFFTDVGMDRLNQINRDVNRAIRPTDDEHAFGKADYWTVPRGPRAEGDCEDYALAKRQALIDAGIPIEALSLAVVETNRRELHAVLLVATPDGEVVLDNLTPWIVPWRQAPYHWLQRQARGSALTWVTPALS